MYDLDADFALFYGPDDPGVVAALYDGTDTIYGHFSNGYSEGSGMIGRDQLFDAYAGGPKIAGRNPVYDCAAASVDADPTGRALVIDSVNYVIRNILPQDDGAWVYLQLEKV